MKGEQMSPNPIMRFEDGGFPDYVMCEVRNAGFAAPTPIQAQGFAISLTGQDFVGIAQTGSGKTLGYMLPAIIHCNNQPYLERGDGPLVLVLAPTRYDLLLFPQGQMMVHYMLDFGILFEDFLKSSDT